jgi:Zn-dependent M28 family amino/carboxypeptidase
MNRKSKIVFIGIIVNLIVGLNPVLVTAQKTGISIDEFKAHLKFLSDDKLQGRAPGTMGGDIAAMYIASQFERCGLKPNSEQYGYFQYLPIRSITTDYKSVSFTITGNSFQETIKPYEEVLVIGRENKELLEFNDELVFVGYGIEAPEYGWDDYKGKDVNGKIVICLNEHPVFKTPGYKPGNTTYYGHWEYRPKIAFDKGAKGILMIHETKATFPWSIWQNFLSMPDFHASDLKAPLPLVAHITENAFDRALKHIGLTTAELIEKAKKKNFSPLPLNLIINTDFKQSIKEFRSPNVIGTIPGYEKPGEAFIYMAHYDHLGIGYPVNNDSIYNGVLDNASGTAALLTLAEYFSEHPAKRTIIFLATNAEEVGFLGSDYYMKNPLTSAEKTLFGVNMDMMGFLGPRDSIELSPLFYTDAVETIKGIGQEMGLGVILSDFDSEFMNFRLDSYPFALYEIVTLNILNYQIKANYTSITKNEIDEIIKSGGLNYHTPFDEIKPWFRYDGILQELELARNIGEHYANDGIKPKFNKGNPFEPVKKLWIRK